ncbi:MAG TPA: hypothetical protein VGH32_06035 [Pirellulales bacterium]
MRFTAAYWLCVAFGLSVLTLPACGSDSGPPGPRQTSAFAERFSEAEGLADGPAKNEAFAKIATQAAAAGDVDAARTALFRISETSLREKAAYKAALAMGKAGKKREAAQLLKSIRDPVLLQKARTKIDKWDWTE